MKILLFGRNGQIGWELNRSLQPLGEVIALGREQADFSDSKNLRAIVREKKPDIIVNAVAYTAVDEAEEQEELAEQINSIAPRVLADEALKIKALLVHYSTDYVFDGAKKGPYVEDDEPNPINAYGRTKLAGECFIKSSGCEYLIFRTSWVYASRGHNFLLTILKLAKERDELSVVADQIGSPTSARLIAETTSICLQKSVKEMQLCKFYSDVYNLTSSDSTSWYSFAKAVLNAANKKLDSRLKAKDIKNILTIDYKTLAKRPNNSQLSLAKLESEFNVVMPNWRGTLLLCLEDIFEK